MTRLDHLTVDTVTYATWAADNASGDPTWGSQSTAACRVEYGTFRVAMAQGVERDYTCRIYTEVDIPDKARLWLPGDDTTSGDEARKVARRVVNTLPGGGLTLYELYL